VAEAIGRIRRTQYDTGGADSVRATRISELEPPINRLMKPAAPTSEPQPLSYEDRQKADKVRLARLAEASASHEAWLTEREKSEMRRLESLKKRSWSEEGWLEVLKRKIGKQTDP
jgi:hypothetical protein